MTIQPNTPYVFTFTLKNFRHPISHAYADLGQVAATVMVSGRGGARLPAVVVGSDPARYPCEGYTSLSATMLASAATMTVTTVTGIIAGRLLVVDDEVMDVVSTSGNVVTVLRPTGGITALNHLAGAPVCVVQAGGKPGLAMPLALWKQGVVLSKIGQSTPLPEASNTMTVTFVSNVVIDNAAWSNIIKLSITGLTGTSTADNSALAVTDIENSGTTTYFGNSGEWDQSSGTLVMTMPIFVSLPAATTLKFSFTLDNPATPQQAPTVSFKVVSTVLMYAGPMEIDPELVPAIPGAAAGDAVPLKVWSSFMCMKAIAQSTPFPGALNTITVSLSPTASLAGSQNSKITIDGLLGAQTADGNLVITDVGGTNANVLFGNTAVWSKAAGKLVLSVANGQTLGGGQMVSLTFQITNPAPKSPAQPILVSTSGTRVLGPERMAVQDRIAPFSSSTTLSQDVSACAMSSIYVASAAGVSTGAVLQIDDELVSVKSVSGTNITVARAFGGTALAHHVRGAAVYLVQPGCTIGLMPSVEILLEPLITRHLPAPLSLPIRVAIPSSIPAFCAHFKCLA